MDRLTPNFKLFLTTLAAVVCAALLLTFCTPAPAAENDQPRTVELVAGNDVGGAILLFSEDGKCLRFGGKMAISLDQGKKPLWYGCWLDAGDTIHVVWFTEQGPRPMSAPRSAFQAAKDPLSGGTKL
jgi:hypothetical protein